MIFAAAPEDVTNWLAPLSTLGQAGVLGILLVLAIWAIIKLYGDLKVERNSRLDDAKALTELVKAATAATVALAAAQEDRNRAYESMVQALNALQRK